MFNTDNTGTDSGHVICSFQVIGGEAGEPLISLSRLWAWFVQITDRTSIF